MNLWYRLTGDLTGGWGIRGVDKRERSVVMLLLLSMLLLLVRSCRWATRNGREPIEGSDIDSGKVGDRVSNVGTPTGRRL